MVIDNTALRTTSQATGDVAASEGHSEESIDAMILDVYLNGGGYSFTLANGVAIDIHRNSPIEGQEE